MDVDRFALASKGSRVLEINQILDVDGKLEAIQLVLSDGSSTIITVWTDWTIRVDHRLDPAVPDYLWPPNERTRVPMENVNTEGGLEIMEVTNSRDTVGSLVGIEVAFPGEFLSIGSWAGSYSAGVRAG